MSIGRGFVAVTPSDANVISKKNGNFPSALRFGTGGTAVIEGSDGTIATFTNIADGETIPVSARRVLTTGSTGIADIVGIYL